MHFRKWNYKNNLITFYAIEEKCQHDGKTPGYIFFYFHDPLPQKVPAKFVQDYIWQKSKQKCSKKSHNNQIQ